MVDAIDQRGLLRRGVTTDRVDNARAVLRHSGLIRLPVIGTLLRAHWAKKHGARMDSNGTS